MSLCTHVQAYLTVRPRVVLLHSARPAEQLTVLEDRLTARVLADSRPRRCWRSARAAGCDWTWRSLFSDPSAPYLIGGAFDAQLEEWADQIAPGRLTWEPLALHPVLE